MKIVNLQIGEFGKLKNRTFELGETLNIIRGDNESGKSTLLLFIKFMLYGLAKKSRGASVSEADRAISWSSDEASGSMMLYHGGKLYRIERRVRRARQLVEKMQVIECQSELVREDIQNPGEYFLGVPVEIFESSCAVSQLRCTSVAGEQVGTTLQNLLSSADESIDVSRVLKSLDMARVKYLHKDARGGSIFDLESKKELLEASYKKAVNDHSETEELKAEIARTDQKLSEVADKKRICDELDSKIKLRATAELFDLLHKREDEKKKTEDELSALVRGIRRGAFVPDSSYLARLRSLEHGIRTLSADVENEKQKLAAKAAEQREDEVAYNNFKIAEELGGLDTVRRSIRRIRGLGAFNTLLCAISPVFAAIGIALGLLVKPVLFTLSAVSVMLLAVAILGIASNKKALRTLLCSFGLSKKELYRFFDGCDEAKENYDTISEEMRRIDAAIRIRERMLRDSISQLVEYLAPFEKCQNTELDSVLQTAERSALQIEEYLSKYAELSAEITGLGAQITSLSAKLSEYNEHQLRHKISPEILAMSEAEIAESNKQKSFYDYQLKMLTQKKTDCERRLLERRYTTQNPFDIATRLDDVKQKLAAEDSHYRALVMAIEGIQTASTSMRNTLTPKIRESAAEYMSQISGNKYSSVGINEKLDISFGAEDGFNRTIEAFSVGTRDAAYIALRLSLLKLLPTDTLPPLFLDETLAMIDSTRAVNILRIVESYCHQGGQCIYFSCHEREEQLCKASGIQYSLTEL